jgi:hypothetical protein
MDKISRPLIIRVSDLEQRLRGIYLNDPYAYHFLNYLSRIETESDVTDIIANVIMSYSEANAKLLKVCIDYAALMQKPTMKEVSNG